MYKTLIKLHPLILSLIIGLNNFSVADNHLPTTNDKRGISISSNSVTIQTPKSIDEERKMTDYKFYSVELILFRHNDKSDLLKEFWVPLTEDDMDLDTEEALPEEENNITAISLMPQFGIPGSTETPVSHFELGEYDGELNKLETYDNLVNQIADEQLELKNEAAHIRYARQYQMLAHFAWIQPGYDAETTLPIKLNLPLKYGDIKGTIKVSLARYLHTEVDLTLVEEVCRQVKKEPESMDVKVQVLLQPELEKNTDKNAAFNPDSEDKDKDKNKLIDDYITKCQMEIIPFNQSRKMRSKKLHYIDHPAFGLLVLINPYKLEQEPEEDEQKISSTSTDKK
ncbi:MAG: hypothetical protein HQL46_12155 [Gammaproteobacteria bacterium]|nr:hypothetical protein [Gammaproteobacteria bacterium]